jgi:tetratricopeptide (TPR) repeat protein
MRLCKSGSSCRHEQNTGVKLANHVFLMENHDQALRIWREAGVKQRVLLHIDAHHDMWWTDDQATVTIANFICPALKEELIREVIWVVPEGDTRGAKNTRPIVAHLREILKQYPESSQRLEMEGAYITASVLGKRLIVCPLRLLSVPQETVLLDIDVDYLMVPRITYGECDHQALLPWCWPSELVSKLQDVRSDLTTVVYSVQGGYTPLQWKYLGDEVVLRLKQSGNEDLQLQGMARIREGAEAEMRGERDQAELNYRVAMDLLPSSAAPPYRLARLLIRLNRLEEGRQFYWRAFTLDSSYRGPYSSTGFQSYWRRQFEAAEVEFRDMHALDPEDAYAHLGLGLLARRRKRWDEAERHLRRALAADEHLIDAQHALASVLVQRGKIGEATSAYERVLKLGLMGRKPLSGTIVTNPSEDRLLDPWHCHAYARLAILYEKAGATAKAVSALRIAIAGGFSGGVIRWRLVRLYLKQRCWGDAAAVVWEAARALPRDARRSWSRRHKWLSG